jgi:hypothetical protein
MDWTLFRAALIRAVYTVIFPLIGALVTYLLGDGVLESIGVTNEMAALIIGGILYGVKKLLFPDTVL